MKLSKRKEQILSLVVENYVAEGEAIGSKALCDELGFSSATIRNEMSDLCRLGYLEQKHVSGGRIPSNKGYRYYVDNLMSRSMLSDVECATIESALRRDAHTPEKILENASNMLARLTNCAAVFTTPADAQAEIQKVELIPASRKTAVLILLTSSGILKNCVCRIDIDIDDNVKTKFENIVNDYFLKKKVTELTDDMLAEITMALGEENYAITPLLSALYGLSKDAGESRTVVECETNLLAHRESYGNINELIDFLKQRDQLSRLVTYDESDNSNTLSILIGSENYFREMETSSMILSRYAFGNNAMGTLGIIGPTRIDYARLIPDVEYLTRLVGKLLAENIDDEEIGGEEIE